MNEDVEIAEVPFDSVHAYLEENGLLECTPASIVKAKKEYWKLYQKKYKQSYSKKQFNIVIEAELLKRIKSKAEVQNCSPGDYVRNLIKSAIEGKQSPLGCHLLIEIEITLLSCLDEIDELIEEYPDFKIRIIPSYKKLEDSLSKIKKLDH